MANLIVRNVEDAVVQALKARAGKAGRSAEALHREILKKALLKPARKPLAAVLAGMPAVGKDADFERIDE